MCDELSLTVTLGYCKLMPLGTIHIQVIREPVPRLTVEGEVFGYEHMLSLSFWYRLIFVSTKQLSFHVHFVNCSCQHFVNSFNLA